MKGLLLTVALLTMNTTVQAQWWTITNELPQANATIPELGDDSFMSVSFDPAEGCRPTLTIILPPEASEELGILSRIMGRVVKARVDEFKQHEGRAELVEVDLREDEAREPRLSFQTRIDQSLVRQLQAGNVLRFKIGYTSTRVLVVELTGSNAAIKTAQTSCKRIAKQRNNDAGYID